MGAEDAVQLDEQAMQLSDVTKTVDGVGFAYSRLDCVGKNVGGIKLLEQYPHLRQIDLSGNSIRDVAPLSKLSHVLSLNLSSNAISSIASWPEDALQHLLFLDLSGNQLTELPNLTMPALRRADFSRNEIASCKHFAGHSRLQALKLSKNQIEHVGGLARLPALETLELGENAVSSFAGMKELPSLTSLDVSKNKFATLEGPWGEVTKLRSINVAGNVIAAASAFQPLGRLGELRTIIAAGNPLEEQEGINLRLELLICHPGLKIIDAEEVTLDERDAAKDLSTKRKEEEEARLAAEAAVAGPED